jgi:hypothetical protein
VLCIYFDIYVKITSIDGFLYDERLEKKIVLQFFLGYIKSASISVNKMAILDYEKLQSVLKVSIEKELNHTGNNMSHIGFYDNLR